MRRLAHRIRGLGQRASYRAKLGLVALLVLAAFGAEWWYRHWQTDRSRVRFAERATGLEMSDVSVADTVDNGEWFVIVRGAVSERHLQEWIAAGTAREIVELEHSDVRFGPIDFGGAVEPEMEAPRLREGWYRIEGCSPDENAWYGVVAPTGDPFWLLVKYPDLGGDGPGCIDDSWFVRTRHAAPNE